MQRLAFRFQPCRRCGSARLFFSLPECFDSTRPGRMDKAARMACKMAWRAGETLYLCKPASKRGAKSISVHAPVFVNRKTTPRQYWPDAGFGWARARCFQKWRRQTAFCDQRIDRQCRFGRRRDGGSTLNICSTDFPAAATNAAAGVVTPHLRGARGLSSIVRRASVRTTVTRSIPNSAICAA